MMLRCYHLRSYTVFAGLVLSLVFLEEACKRNTPEQPEESKQAFEADSNAFIDEIAFSPDGKFLVSCRNDLPAVTVWDVDSGREVFDFDAHEVPVISVKVSADGQWVASADWERTVYVWELLTQEPVHVFQAPPTSDGISWSPMMALAFDPHTRFLAGAGQYQEYDSKDQVIKVRNLETGKELTNFVRPHEGKISFASSVTFSPDGKLLASGNTAGIITLWSIPGGEEIQTLYSSGGAVYALDFAPDNSTLACAHGDRTISTWDLSTGQVVRILKGHTHVVNSVAFNSTGTQLASGSFDGSLKLWDTESWEEMQTLNGGAKTVRGVTFHPQKPLVASANGDGTITLWDTKKGRIQQVFTPQLIPLPE